MTSDVMIDDEQVANDNADTLKPPAGDVAVIRRFFDEVAVTENISDEGDRTDYCISLSGSKMKKPVFVRTETHEKLLLPTRRLAEAVAAEWDAQETEIDFNTMPLTSIAITASDHVLFGREEILANLKDHVEADQVYYRSSRSQDLAKIQAEKWQPLLNWVKEKLEVDVAVTKGVMPIPQYTDTIDAIMSVLKSYDNTRLTIAYLVSSTCSSILIGIALVEGIINAEEAFDLAHIDETYNIDTWGVDPIIVKRRKIIQSDIEKYKEFLDLAT